MLLNINAEAWCDPRIGSGDAIHGTLRLLVNIIAGEARIRRDARSCGGGLRRLLRLGGGRCPTGQLGIRFSFKPMTLYSKSSIC